MRVWQALGWYARRLSVMGPREIAHRLAALATLNLLRLQRYVHDDWGCPRLDLAETATFCTARDPQLPESDWIFDPKSPAVGDLLEGVLDALGHRWRWSEDAQIWHRAPDTGALWPGGFFADIPYRSGNPYGDVRVAWEPARLQWLIGLALAARSLDAPRREAAVALLERALMTWVVANPPLSGIHYISAMECALRLIAACHAVDLARVHLRRRREVFAALLKLVSSHARLIEKRLSLYSSAGNHTIAECAGLVYAGVLFPELPGAGRWKDQGLRILDREFCRQILEDGGGAEQAFRYLQFITDLGELVTRLLAHRGEDIPVAIPECTRRSRRFLSELVGRCGTLPPVGDSDDGYALSPWLRGAACPAGSASAYVHFSAAGYLLVSLPGPDEMVVLFDHGPLGMPPSYGHGHADALSVLVWLRGKEILLDPGTYTYTGSPAWRRYFRSTAAHNTICVDHLDQAVQETAFMWSKPFRSEMVRLEQKGEICHALARHDGYAGRRGVVHWRGIAVRPGALLVWDFLDGSGSHHLALAWHTSVPVSGEAHRWRLGEDMVLEIEGAQELGCVSGGPESPYRWSAPAYGRKAPICTITAENNGPLPCQFLSRIYRQGSVVPRESASQDLALFTRWMK